MNTFDALGATAMLYLLIGLGISLTGIAFEMMKRSLVLRITVGLLVTAFVVLCTTSNSLDWPMASDTVMKTPVVDLLKP